MNKKIRDEFAADLRNALPVSMLGLPEVTLNRLKDQELTYVGLVRITGLRQVPGIGPVKANPVRDAIEAIGQSFDYPEDLSIPERNTLIKELRPHFALKADEARSAFLSGQFGAVSSSMAGQPQTRVYSFQDAVKDLLRLWESPRFRENFQKAVRAERTPSP